MYSFNTYLATLYVGHWARQEEYSHHPLLTEHLGLFLGDLQLNFTAKCVNKLQWWRHEKSTEHSKGVQELTRWRQGGKLHQQKQMCKGYRAGRGRKRSIEELAESETGDGWLEREYGYAGWGPGGSKAGPCKVWCRAAGYHWRVVPGERHEEIYMLKDRMLFAGREEVWGGWEEASVV